MSIAANASTSVGTIIQPEMNPTCGVDWAWPTTEFVNGIPPEMRLFMDAHAALSMEAPNANKESMTYCWDCP